MARQQRLQLTEFGLNTIIGDLQSGPGALRVAHNVVVPASGRVEKTRGFHAVTRRTNYVATPDLNGGSCINSIISSKTLGQNVLLNAGINATDPLLGISIIQACSLLYGDGYTNPWWALQTPDNRTVLNDSYTRQKSSVNQKTLFLTGQRTPLRLESGIEQATDATVASAQLSYAGMPQAPGISWYQQVNNELVSVSGANWLGNGMFVAYRFVWGTVDIDGNERLSPPSGRYIIGNTAVTRGYSAGADMCPQLFVAVPFVTESVSIPIDTLPTNLSHRRWFLRVYRSQIMASVAGAAPDDELQLCYEVWPTAAQVSSRRVQFTDTCPPAGLTAALYTNQTLGGDVNSGVLVAGSTGLGLASKNDRPPIAKDTALFADCTFWANFTTPYRLTLSVLGVQSTAGGPLLSPGDTITIASGTGGSQAFTGTIGVPGSSSEFFIETGYSSIALNIRQTVMNLCASINTQMGIAGGNIVAVYNGNDASPGTIGQFYLETIQQEFNPNIIATGTGLGSVGAQSSTRTPWLPLQQTDTGGSSGWYFTREDAPNGLAISKPLQGDAVPPVNYLRVGRADTVIQRILPTTNALYILCDDGAYWLRGTAPTNFQIERLDPTCRIWWRESAVTLNDSVFLWAREGLFQIQNGSTIRLDTPIRGTIESVRFNNSQPVIARSNFAWANPFDNTVTFCWANLDTANIGSGGSPYQAFIWNANTGAWTTRQMNHMFNGSFVSARSCAVARWIDGAVYMGCPEDFSSGGFVFTDISTGQSIGEPEYFDTLTLGDASTVSLSLQATMEWVTSVPNPGSICHWSEFQAFSQPGSIVYADDGGTSLNLEYAINEAGRNPAFPIVDEFTVTISSEVAATHTIATINPTSTQGRCYIATSGGYAARQTVRIEHVEDANGDPAGCSFTGFAIVYRPISGRTTR